MGELVKQGIAPKESVSTRLFESILSGETFMTIQYETPKDYVKQYCDALRKAGLSSPNGNLFKYIIYSLLYREDIRPFFIHAHLDAVPLVNFDVLLFNQISPITLTLKTILRERYKQADLEAVALKYIYRRSKCYLLTMDTHEANVQKAKIQSGDIMGLDEIIDCNSEDINQLVSNLKTMSFSTSVKIDAVRGNLIQ